MLAVSHRPSEPLPTLHRRVMEDHNTINPAALNASGKLSPCPLPQPLHAARCYVVCCPAATLLSTVTVFVVRTL